MITDRVLIRACDDPDFQTLERHTFRSNPFSLTLYGLAFMCMLVMSVRNIVVITLLDDYEYFELFILLQTAVPALLFIFARWIEDLHEWLRYRKRSRQTMQELLARVR